MAGLRHWDLRPKEREDNIKRSSATINKSILQLVMCCTFFFAFFAFVLHTHLPRKRPREKFSK